MNIQNGLPDGTKPLPSMLTVKSNDIDLRSISQEILQPTITNISFKIVHLNIQFNLTGANQLKINILPIKITKEIYFHKKKLQHKYHHRYKLISIERKAPRYPRVCLLSGTCLYTGKYDFKTSTPVW